MLATTQKSTQSNWPARRTCAGSVMASTVPATMSTPQAHVSWISCSSPSGSGSRRSFQSNARMQATTADMLSLHQVEHAHHAARAALAVG
jgi:hypothetical protein